MRVCGVSLPLVLLGNDTRGKGPIILQPAKKIRVGRKLYEEETSRVREVTSGTSCHIAKCSAPFPTWVLKPRPWAWSQGKCLLVVFSTALWLPASGICLSLLLRRHPAILRPSTGQYSESLPGSHQSPGIPQSSL